MEKNNVTIKYDILKIGEEAKKAKELNNNVINGTIGSFYNEMGEFKGFDIVKKVLYSLNDTEVFAYATSDGGIDFENAVLKWVFKGYLDQIRSNTCCKVVATPGGTGAIFAGVFSSLNQGDKIIIPDLCWEPYLTIATINGIHPKRYSFFDSNHHFNIKEFIKCCDQIASEQDKIVSIINDPCNNPTGYSMSYDEFSEIINYFSSIDKEVVLMYDIAYFDYSFNLNETLNKLLLLSTVNENITTLICFSASKSFSAYGMRLGAQIILNKNYEKVNALFKKTSVIARTHWSNINKAGISFMIKITSNIELLKSFEDELNNNIEILYNRIAIFNNEAKECVLEVYPVKGGFFIAIPCSKPEEAFEMLKEENIYIIPLESSLRIAICSIPSKEVYGLAFTIKKVFNKLNK